MTNYGAFKKTRSVVNKSLVFLPYTILVCGCGCAHVVVSSMVEKHLWDLPWGQQVRGSFLVLLLIGESKNWKRSCFITRIRSCVGLSRGLELEDLNFSKKLTWCFSTSSVLTSLKDSSRSLPSPPRRIARISRAFHTMQPVMGEGL